MGRNIVKLPYTFFFVQIYLLREKILLLNMYEQVSTTNYYYCLSFFFILTSLICNVYIYIYIYFSPQSLLFIFPNDTYEKKIK